ncbi:hypothetical protein JX265_008126 [Neoarthrinium moseri]|uniref:Uncharacterized protein n=1 Tax=Neoarthrinium moseri TaxID=1658444 RepID=A0A9P9WIB0_9PEZI|nr:hypothetical protein JX265_008126 [Neoarthrinium moseri]
MAHPECTLPIRFIFDECSHLITQDMMSGACRLWAEMVSLGARDLAIDDPEAFMLWIDSFPQDALEDDAHTSRFFAEFAWQLAHLFQDASSSTRKDQDAAAWTRLAFAACRLLDSRCCAWLTDNILEFGKTSSLTAPAFTESEREGLSLIACEIMAIASSQRLEHEYLKRLAAHMASIAETAEDFERICTTYFLPSLSSNEGSDLNSARMIESFEVLHGVYLNFVHDNIKPLLMALVRNPWTQLWNFSTNEEKAGVELWTKIDHSEWKISRCFEELERFIYTSKDAAGLEKLKSLWGDVQKGMATLREASSSVLSCMHALRRSHDLEDVGYVPTLP